MFRKLVNPQVRNTLVTDMLSFSYPADDTEEETHPYEDDTQASVPPILNSSLTMFLGFTPPRHANFLSHFMADGITYSVSSKHLGNSCVLIVTGSENEPVPARIDYIFQVYVQDSLQTLVAVRRHKPTENLSDPFLQYPILQVRMWSKQFHHTEIIKTNAIKSHFASCSMIWQEVEATVVISLSRVGMQLLTYMLPTHNKPRNTDYLSPHTLYHPPCIYIS